MRPRRRLSRPAPIATVLAGAVRLLLLAAAMCGPWGGAWASDAAAAPRFFFSGDGRLEMRSGHFDETLRVRYRDAVGRYDPEAIAAIERFFRSRTDGASGPISLRLVELIDYVQDRYRLSGLTLVSGYRSPEFNQALRDDGRRVAQASLHTEGLAADVAPAGVDLRRLWLQLRQDRVGGVGLYRKDGFLHLDTGQPRFWEPVTSGVDKNLSADNARLFARTDFDRYGDLDGAVVTLHSVTATPLGVRREAHLGDRSVILVPRGPQWILEGDCYVVTEPAARYELVVANSVAPPGGRTPLRLRTCGERIGATPAEIATNAIASLRDAPVATR